MVTLAFLIGFFVNMARKLGGDVRYDGLYVYVYSKEIPKPPNQAGRKALVTRIFNNVKNHLMIARK